MSGRPQHDHRGAPGPEEETARETAAEFRHNLEEHLQARAELFSLEAREAGEWIASRGVLAVLALLLGLVAYGLLLVALIALFGSWLEGAWPAIGANRGWQVVALAAGVGHLLGALVLLRHLKNTTTKPNFFEFTRSEFHKDREWLQKRHFRKKNDDLR